MRSILLLFLLGHVSFMNAQTEIPAHMGKDTVHSPFHFGVASGDPQSDGFVIWTCVDTLSQTPISLNWEVSQEADFSVPEASGTVLTSPEYQHTAKVRVTGLEADERYYYRFSLNDAVSAIGRGRKLPDATDSLTFAVASCSSIYSGYFNAYGRMAERDEIDFVVHLGDYIYDFVDEDEQVLVPDPFPQVPVSADEWMDRHRYYLLDAELRELRRQHTWIHMWDNHDLKPDAPEEGAEAFYAYTAVEAAEDPLHLYRSYAFGQLASLITADITLHRDVDQIGGEPSLLGTEQRNWLQEAYAQNEATWRILGNQKMLGGWYTTGIDPALLSLVPNDGDVFDGNSWDGYPVSRDSLLGFFRAQEVVNNVVISGDAHITMAMDLIEDPYDPLAYDPLTGSGAIGVEFLPASISRGNLDEQEPLTIALHDTLIGINMQANPHHLFNDFLGHGYGLLKVYPDSVVAEAWHCPILEQSDDEERVVRLKCLSGSGHWSRDVLTTVKEKHRAARIKVYPNPTNGEVVVESVLEIVDLRLIDAQGNRLQHEVERSVKADVHLYRLDLRNQSSGTYLIIAGLSNGAVAAARLIVE